MKLHEITKNITVLLTTIITTLLILEIIIQHTIPVSYNYWEYNQNFHHTFSKNLNITRNYWNNSIDLTTDNQGFRSEQYPRQKPKNTKRILVLGDSITTSISIPSNKIFTKIISDNLNQNSPTKWEVINRGMEAWSTDIEYLYLTKEAYKYTPDIIILQFTQNDIIDIVAYNITQIQNNKLTIKTKFEPLTTKQKIKTYANRYSALYRLTANFYNTHIKNRQNETNFYMSNGYNQEFYEAFQKITTLIEAMNQYAKKQNSTFIIAIYADPRAVNKEYYEFWKKLQKNYIPQNELQKPIDLLTKHLTKQKIPFTDTSNTINETSDYISLEDGHLSAKGNQKMADAIYQKIIRTTTNQN